MSSESSHPRRPGSPDGPVPVSLSLAVRFLLELGALVALAYWGWTVSGPFILRGVLAVGAPAVAALVWGLFVAPNARRRLDDPLRLILELVVFAAAALALLTAGRDTYALGYAVLVVVDEALLAYFGQR